MISVCKAYEFAAAHHLPNHAGKCKVPHGHGYVLEVEVHGGIVEDGRSSDDGMVIDFGDLDAIVKPLLDHPGGLDHSDLNTRFTCPTAENLVEYFRCAICALLPNSYRPVSLTRVRIWETSKAYAEWKR
jgi:6-pyruvoyltetrahydropterin/6-carboxytetrahydropterin synthase